MAWGGKPVDVDANRDLQMSRLQKEGGSRFGEAVDAGRSRGERLEEDDEGLVDGPPGPKKPNENPFSREDVWQFTAEERRTLAEECEQRKRKERAQQINLSGADAFRVLTSDVRK